MWSKHSLCKHPPTLLYLHYDSHLCFRTVKKLKMLRLSILREGPMVCSSITQICQTISCGHLGLWLLTMSIKSKEQSCNTLSLCKALGIQHFKVLKNKTKLKWWNKIHAPISHGCLIKSKGISKCYKLTEPQYNLLYVSLFVKVRENRWSLNAYTSLKTCHQVWVWLVITMRAG